MLSIQNIKITSSLIGNYNIYNLASSITIGIYFQVSIYHIQKAIQKYIPNNYRSQLIEINNKKIILDCYNANPTSMMKALTFFNNHIFGNKIVILGDMLELGVFSNKEHEKILLFIKNSNINFGFFIGEIFFYTNIYYTKMKKFLNKESFLNWIKKYPIKNSDFILIKGSRKIALENIIHLI
ncbi:glutamate ligase domain-containing protein [Blattabacterium cuenoti]|uniref:glutamate ligase domain-containing protein n=1 Tax=Blattabacterium cuenoti TaxID=1653831 RepID=UPI001EE9C772|nr:cyanophycin synthetase [Blattabacterium cuenoti]